MRVVSFDEDDDNWVDIRDLVEPVARPRRFQESVVEPWLAAANLGPEWNPSPPDEHSYVEWQLVGGVEEDDDSSSLARVLALLTTEPPLDEEEEDDDDDDEDDPSATAIKRLLSFLFNDSPKTRIVWLSRSRFLTCNGPNSGPYDAFWDFYWSQQRCPLDVLVKRTAADEEAGNEAPGYSFRLNGFGVEGDRWPTALARLLSRAPGAAWFWCGLVPGPDPACLEALVSIGPPRGADGSICSRTLSLSSATEESARTVAFRTHRDTAIAVNVYRWREGGVAALTEALEANQCPRRQILSGFVGTGVPETFARALRATAAVEELEVELPDAITWPDPENCSSVLLDAIRGSVGIRRLVATHGFGANPAFLKDFWSAVLASRSLQSVDASRIVRHPFLTDGDRQECARHVVALLRSNHVVTEIKYDPHSHDPAIMNAEAVPLLQLNRLRAAAFEVNRSLALFLGSALVRRNPMLRYHVLRSNAETVARHLLPSSLGPGTDQRRGRPHPFS